MRIMITSTILYISANIDITAEGVLIKTHNNSHAKSKKSQNKYEELFRCLSIIVPAILENAMRNTGIRSIKAIYSVLGSKCSIARGKKYSSQKKNNSNLLNEPFEELQTIISFFP